MVTTRSGHVTPVSAGKTENLALRSRNGDGSPQPAVKRAGITVNVPPRNVKKVRTSLDSEGSGDTSFHSAKESPGSPRRFEARFEDALSSIEGELPSPQGAMQRLVEGTSSTEEREARRTPGLEEAPSLAQADVVSIPVALEVGEHGTPRQLPITPAHSFVTPAATATGIQKRFDCNTPTNVQRQSPDVVQTSAAVRNASPATDEDEAPEVVSLKSTIQRARGSSKKRARGKDMLPFSGHFNAQTDHLLSKSTGVTPSTKVLPDDMDGKPVKTSTVARDTSQNITNAAKTDVSPDSIKHTTISFNTEASPKTSRILPTSKLYFTDDVKPKQNERHRPLSPKASNLPPKGSNSLEEYRRKVLSNKAKASGAKRRRGVHFQEEWSTKRRRFIVAS